jgi:hypothetical protein
MFIWVIIEGENVIRKNMFPELLAICEELLTILENHFQ